MNTDTPYTDAALEIIRNPPAFNRYRVRLSAVHPGDVIPGLGTVVSNEPNGRNRLITLDDGCTYSNRYNHYESIERPR